MRGTNYPEPSLDPPAAAFRTAEAEREQERSEAARDALIREARGIADDTSDAEVTDDHVRALVARVDELTADDTKRTALRLHTEARYHDLIDAVQAAGHSIGLTQAWGETTRAYLLRIAAATPKGGAQ